MKQFLFTFILLLLLVSHAAGSDSKTFTISMRSLPGKTLVIDFYNADIKINPAEDDNIYVRAVVNIEDSHQHLVKEFLAKTEFSLRSYKDQYLLELHTPRMDPKFNRRGKGPVSTHIKLDIRVPVNRNLNIKNRHADIIINDINSEININNSSGVVEVNGGKGKLEIKNSFALVSVTGFNGPVKIDNSNGEVQVTDVQKDVLVVNSFKPIRIKRVKGSLTIKGQSSMIDVQGVGGEVDITNSYKSVILKETRCSIYVKGDYSMINVSKIKQMPKHGTITLITRDMPITLELPANAKVQVSGYALNGKIHSHLPVERLEKSKPGNRGSPRIKGRTKIYLETSNNDITILKK